MILNPALRWAGIAIFCVVCFPAPASTVSVGVLSYDTFIPSSPGSPGVDAFDLANLTGGFSLPSDFPVTDDLTLGSATLTVTLSDLSQNVFALGDIGPGFLLDPGGNPIVQVPDGQAFLSAEFTATLSPLSFTLFDGRTFAADSSSIDVLLLPSSGATLTVDVDQTTVNVAGTVQTSTPEPAGRALLVLALLGLAGIRHRQQNVRARFGVRR